MKMKLNERDFFAPKKYKSKIEKWHKTINDYL